MTVNSYKDLEVWQRSMKLAIMIYELTEKFPNDEAYGLRSQIRRASISIPSNIAEGHGRDSLKEYLRHLSIAQGSLAEIETQIILASELSFTQKNEIKKILQDTDILGKMLRNLQKALKKKLTPNLRVIPKTQNPEPNT